MTAEKKNPNKKPVKSYAPALQSLMDIWRVLAQYASPDHPMTVKEIWEKLAQESEEAPSRSTVSRKLAQQIPAMNLLCPHQVVEQSGHSAVVQTYTVGDTLHVVVENRDGEAFREDSVTVVLQPRSCHAPSYAAIDKLLQRFPACEDGWFPFTLQCVKLVNQKGRTRYIPYSDWEEQYDEDRSANNQPRRYYLSSVLTPAEWRIFSDLVTVYPYISETQTEKFLQILRQLSPGSGSRIGSRYAFKRGSPQQFQHIAVLDRAIRNGKAVGIQYGEYTLVHEDGAWKPVLKRRKKNGLLEIEPYALMWSNGYYYLVGKNRGMMNLRIDRILSVAELERTFRQDPGFDPYVYRDRSPVMYPGTPQLVRLRCKLTLLNTLLDFFGPQPTFSQPEDGWTTLSMTIAPGGVKLFALQYVDSVEVLEPATLREQVLASLRSALERYQ